MNSNNNNHKFSLEILKSQLMSLFMLKSCTSTTEGSSFYKIISSILTISVIDNIILSIPVVTKFASSYISKNMSEIKILETKNEPKKITKSSITIEINLAESEPFSNAILYHITNSSNIKSVLYSHERFILNNKDVVLCDGTDEIYFRLVSETKTPENHTTAQIIELYSYVLEMIELRNIIDDIGNGRVKKNSR